MTCHQFCKWLTDSIELNKGRKLENNTIINQILTFNFRDPLLSELISTVRARLDQLEEEEEENNLNGSYESETSDDEDNEEGSDEEEALFSSESDGDEEDEDGMADADEAGDDSDSETSDSGVGLSE